MEAVKQNHIITRSRPAAHAVSRKAASSEMPPKMPGVQAKLSVNKPGDGLEREADAMADKVMRMSNAGSITQYSALPMVVQRKCSHCKEEEKKLQRKEATGVDAGPASAQMRFVEHELALSKGGGEPLPAQVNTLMSSRMNADFSAVRIHTSPRAIAMCKVLHAHAFTHGKDIYFNTGMYNPQSAQGQHLLAHELTHVIQQGYAKPLQAGPAVPTAATPAVQRLGIDDLAELNPLSVSIDSLVRKYAPELLEIKQAGGIAPWLEEKIAGAVKNLLNTAVAPIKAGADFAAGLSPTLAKIINWVKTAGVKISKNDCSSFTELGAMIEELLDELAAPAIEKIKEFASRASAWCSDMWQKFGVPVWEFIKNYYAAQWEFIKNLGSLIWQKTAPVREWAESVWIKFKNWLGIGEGPEGQNGIIQWIERKITEIWEKIKAKIEPFKKQLMIVGGVLLMLSPAGPLIAAGVIFTGVFKAVQWIRANIHSPADIVKLRVKFEKEILPLLMNNLQSAAAALKMVFGKLTGSIQAVLGAFGKLADLVAGTLISVIQSVLQWVTGKLSELAELATAKLTELATWLHGIFNGLRAFIVTLIQFFEKVSAVANSIMDLPMLILGGLWKRIPSCIRVPVEDFLVNSILKKVPFFEDVVAIANVWQKLRKGALDVIKTVFITGDLKAAILKAFKLFLDVLNIPLQLVTGIYEKAKNAFDTIVSKPKVIFGNIVAAIKAGFQKFYKNFLKNTLDAAGNWIFSKVKGVKMPKEFTIQSIFGLVLDILGLTEENIFKRIEKKTNRGFAEKLRAVYNTLKGAAAWVVKIIKDPKAAYEEAKQHLKNLKTKLFQSIGAWIAESVIGKFMAEMIAMLASTPFGEAIEAIIDTYKMIKTAVEYAERVLRVIDSVLDAVLDLAAGVITKAVDTVEKGLVIGMEVALAFIAKVISIGDLPEQVKKIIEQDIRPLIDSAIDAVIDGIIAVLKTLKEFAGDVKDAVLEAFNWNKTKVTFTAENGEPHSTYIEHKAGKVTLIIASSPRPGRLLLDEYRKEHKDNKKKMDSVNNAETVLKEVETIAQEIAIMQAQAAAAKPDRKAEMESSIAKKLQLLLLAETTLTLHLYNIFKGSDYTEFKNIYELEGSVGMHMTSPKSAKAKFAADHQPANHMLDLASQQPGAPELLKQVVKRRSAMGFTIVLGDYRHYEGRTYGGKAGNVASLFVITVNELFKGASESRKVVLLEHALRDAAIKDAEQMEQVVGNKNLQAPQWRDVNESDLSKKDKDKLREQIERQVRSGESRIKSTSISINTGALT